MVDYYKTLDFGKVEDFEVGIEHGSQDKYVVYDPSTKKPVVKTGVYHSPWDRGGYFQSIRPNAYNFIPISTPRRSGTNAAVLRLLNPVDYESCRLQLLHDWSPFDEYIWQECWYYIPSDFVINGFVTIHKTITERCWIEQDGITSYPKGTYFEFNGQGIALYIDGRSSRPTYGKPIFVIMRGQAGNGHLPDGYHGLSDIYASDAKQTASPHTWINGVPEWVPILDDWFMIRTFAHRNVQDFLNRQTENYNNGTFKCWMSFPPKHDVELVYPVRTEGNIGFNIPNNERTIGIYPDLLDTIGWHHTTKGMAYVASGIANYTSEGSIPKELYVDDYMLCNMLTPPPPISLIKVGIALSAVTAVTVAAVHYKKEGVK